jgi:hypothetical protein
MRTTACHTCGATVSTEAAECPVCLARNPGTQNSTRTRAAHQPTVWQGAAAAQRVVVTDIRMDFWSMVVFMVKWAVASIPAVLILLLVGMIVSSLGVAILGAIANGQ